MTYLILYIVNHISLVVIISVGKTEYFLSLIFNKHFNDSVMRLEDLLTILFKTVLKKLLSCLKCLK